MNLRLDLAMRDDFGYFLLIGVPIEAMFIN